MAKAKLNPVVEEISQSIGDLTFYTRNGKTFIRRKPVPKNPRTEIQQANRNAFGAAVALWRELPAAARESWNNYAKDKKHSGYNAFISENSRCLREGDPPVLTKKNRY